jgi:hypothetical protein
MKKFYCITIIEAESEEDAYIELIDSDNHDLYWEINEE